MRTTKRKTTEQFIEDAISIHGTRYDYSEADYINAHTRLTIICPHHGRFQQLPMNHLEGSGCPICKIEKAKKPMFGVGMNDLSSESFRTPAYIAWAGMLQRGFSQKFKAKHSSYKDVSVCSEWLVFSKFKEWFDNPINGFQDGYQLDKDILVKGNKIYSPDTCCFVPNAINGLILRCAGYRGEYPIGVHKNNRRYSVSLRRRHLGTFDTVEEAFMVYKEAKESLIKEMATEYFNKGAITRKVYDALMRYTIEITD